LASGVVALFFASIFTYFSVAGLIHMVTARIILAFAWVLGVVGIVISETIWGKGLRHRIRIGLLSAATLAAVLFGIDTWTVHHLPREEYGTVAVFFGDTTRFPATPIQFRELNDLPSLLPAILSTLPTRRAHLHAGEKSVVMSVIVRNTSNVDIRSARVTILSTNLEITGKTLGMLPFDPNQVVCEIGRLHPFNRLGEESFLSLEIKTPRCLNHFIPVVMVDGEHMQKFMGVGRIEFWQDTPCAQ
jgi:hypothetical protein